MTLLLTVINHERNEKIELDARIDRDDDQWIGIVTALGVATYGEDEALVRDDLLGLTLHFLNSIEADGERERVLDRHDVRVMKLDERPLADEDDEPLSLHQWIADKDLAAVASR